MGTGVSGISKGGGFFPNLRTKGGPSQRENSLAQNGSNSVFQNGKQPRMLALPVLND